MPTRIRPNRYKPKKELTPNIRCQMEVLEYLLARSVGIIPDLIQHVTNNRQVRKVIRTLVKERCIRCNGGKYTPTELAPIKLATIRKQYKYVWGE